MYLDLMGDSSHESCSGGGGGDCDGDGWVDYQVNTTTIADPQIYTVTFRRHNFAALHRVSLFIALGVPIRFEEMFWLFYDN